MNNLPILETIECSCETCVSACRKKPGWFLPEEITPAANSLGMTDKDFFEKYLGVDYYWKDGEHNYVLSPAVKSMNPGEMFPFSAGGECVFFENGKCNIHENKPYECKIYDHRHLAPDDIHEKVSEQWVPHKDEIKSLYGKEPVVPVPTMIDLLGFLKNF